MSTLTSQETLDQLKLCFSLTEKANTHEEAKQAFQQVRDRVERECPDALQIVDMLWAEVVSAKRSAIFWQELSDMEKHLGEKMAEQQVQLRQNYNRLMQEQ
ncbi:MAG: hypothetical protein AAF289_03945 [Cyanobacteria bacterium P01_A01_bin.135]